MTSRIASRIGELVITLFITSLAIFGAIYLVPGSPISYLAGGRNVSPTTVATISAEYHLNDGFVQRYWLWLSGLFHGNLGTSLVYNESVWHVIEPRIGTTLLLVLLATLETSFIGIILGTLAALRGRSTDFLVTTISTIGVGIPAFAASAVLISAFGLGLKWFPVAGGGTGFVGELDHVFLPSVALSISSVAYVARLSRTAVRHERSSEYVETALARGLSMKETVRRHILRNSLPSILTAIGVSFVGLMATEVVVEGAFGLNGLGSLLVAAVGEHDLAVVQVIVLLYVALFMIVNTITDLVAMAIDPRLVVLGTS